MTTETAIKNGQPMPYFCPACQAIPAAGHCNLAGCPTALPAILSRLTQAERALKPFADFARIGNPRPHELICGSTGSSGRSEVTGAHFHAAAAHFTPALQAPQP